MPELPDIELYRAALGSRIVGQPLTGVRLSSPFLVRSVEPPVESLVGRSVEGLERIGKRIVWRFTGGLFAVFHLMIGGRFRWREPGAAIPGKLGLAAFDLPAGTVLVTEAGSRKQASLHIVSGRAALDAMDPGGVELSEIDAARFTALLRRENHTLKRALTDPHLFSGIGNAYSDEVLHAAKLSPVKLTQTLSDDETRRLYETTTRVLGAWTERLIRENGEGFPERVTAFREGMAVHGRYRQPCPVCGAPIQRIVYARNEANYCPVCQTGGRLLADRALSRLLRNDWPRTLEELERSKDERR
jgi:formamidopyrimidine-DNA glycosylase